jgi:four helix bundle protein
LLIADWELAMDRDEMRSRTKSFAVRVIRLSQSLPNNNVGWVIGKQLIKSGTSIGANYHEALRSSSQSHFVSIIEVALREACETKYWLEILVTAEIVDLALIADLDDECDQLIRILTATSRTAKQRISIQQSAIPNQQ